MILSNKLVHSTGRDLSLQGCVSRCVGKVRNSAFVGSLGGRWSYGRGAGIFNS